MKIKIRKKDRKLIFIGSALLISIVSLFLFRNVLILGVFLVMNAIFNYHQGKLELPFDLTPSLVLVIIFSIKLGFVYGLIFLFLGSVIPSVVARGFNHMTFLFVGLAVGISYLGSMGITDNVMLYGIGLIATQSVFGFFIAKLFADEPTTIFSVFLGLIVNIFYFLILEGILFKILI